MWVQIFYEASSTRKQNLYTEATVAPHYIIGKNSSRLLSNRILSL